MPCFIDVYGLLVSENKSDFKSKCIHPEGFT